MKNSLKIKCKAMVINVLSLWKVEERGHGNSPYYFSNFYVNQKITLKLKAKKNLCFLPIYEKPE